MFDETPIFHVKISNHQIGTIMLKLMFRVPGLYLVIILQFKVLFEAIHVKFPGNNYLTTWEEQDAETFRRPEKKNIGTPYKKRDARKTPEM